MFVTKLVLRDAALGDVPRAKSVIHPGVKVDVLGMWKLTASLLRSVEGGALVW